MDMFSTEPPFSLRCVASATGFDSQERASRGEAKGQRSTGPVSNYFRNAEWTPDGTSIITNSADNHVRTFVLPPELLEERDGPLNLSPYSDLPSAEPVYAFAAYPFFSLSDPSTTLLLSSVREHPIRLTSALDSATFATYSLINPTTEAFITPHSLLYPPELSGQQFLTGSDSSISIFDVSRPGKDGPVVSLPTIPSKRKKIVGGGVGMKGIVSTLALSPTGDGILAAGTFTRQIGLYAANGSGDSLGTFPIVGTPADRQVGGTGITQLLWSPCGRYLYVVERMSCGVMIYDIRVTGQQLGWLEGRKAMTNQRLNVDIIPGTDRDPCEFWAGSTDGEVMVWTNPETSVDGKTPDWTLKLHNDPVSSAAMHPLGSVLATSSGQKQFFNDVDEDMGALSAKSCGMDNSLRVWSLS